MTPPRCPRCENRMTEGFVSDQGYGATFVAQWNPGPPDKRWWGLKITKAKQRPIASFRCDRCDLIENYAP